MEGVTEGDGIPTGSSLAVHAGLIRNPYTPAAMKLGVLIAILGEHSPMRDNLCHPERASSAGLRPAFGGNEGRPEVCTTPAALSPDAAATASNPAGWPE